MVAAVSGLKGVAEAAGHIFGDAAVVFPLTGNCLYRGCTEPARYLVASRKGHMHLCMVHAVEDIGAGTLALIEANARSNEKMGGLL